jgi:hypothetical protein
VNALAGNEDVLRGVLAGCGDCIKILDLDGRLQFMSEGGRYCGRPCSYVSACPVYHDFRRTFRAGRVRRASISSKMLGTPFEISVANPS